MYKRATRAITFYLFISQNKCQEIMEENLQVLSKNVRIQDSMID